MTTVSLSKEIERLAEIENQFNELYDYESEYIQECIDKDAIDHYEGLI